MNLSPEFFEYPTLIRDLQTEILQIEGQLKETAHNKYLLELMYSADIYADPKYKNEKQRDIALHEKLRDNSNYKAFLEQEKQLIWDKGQKKIEVMYYNNMMRIQIASLQTSDSIPQVDV